MSSLDQNNETSVNPQELTLLSPDSDLAIAAITRHIESAETEGLTPEQVEVLQLQLVLSAPYMGEGRSINDMVAFDESRRAERALQERGVSVGESSADLVRPRFASEERWRIVGVDPSQYAGRPVTASVVEGTWHEASKAEQRRKKAEESAKSAEAHAQNALAQFLETGLLETK